MGFELEDWEVALRQLLRSGRYESGKTGTGYGIQCCGERISMDEINQALALLAGDAAIPRTGVEQ